MDKDRCGRCGSVLIFREEKADVLCRRCNRVLAWSRSAAGKGDQSDVDSGRCCPHCREMLTDHNRAVWEAGYAVGQRHAKGEAAS